MAGGVLDVERDPRLVRLSEEHHHALVFALRLRRELPDASEQQAAALYGDLLRLWTRGLLPHFHAESECLLARLVRHVPDDDPDARRLHADHFRFERLVAEMVDATTSEQRRSAMAAFGERLREHVRWEERVFFETIEERLTERELDAAGEEIAGRLPKPTHAPWEDGERQ